VSSQGVPSVPLHVSQIEVWLTQAKMTTSQMSPGRGDVPLDARQWEQSDEICRYVFHIRRRKVTVWVWESEHIQSQILSDGELGDSIPPITLVGNTVCQLVFRCAAMWREPPSRAINISPPKLSDHSRHIFNICFRTIPSGSDIVNTLSNRTSSSIRTAH